MRYLCVSNSLALKVDPVLTTPRCSWLVWIEAGDEGLKTRESRDLVVRREAQVAALGVDAI